MPSQTPPRNSWERCRYLYRQRRKRWAEEFLPDMDEAMWQQYCQWIKGWQPPKETQVRDAPEARC